MSCEQARDLFSALVDEALPSAERRDLDAHLLGCAECRRELEAFRGSIALVHSAPPLRAPAGFVDRVLAAARPAPWYRRLGRRLFVPLRVKVPIEAAAVLVVAVIAVQLYRETPGLERAAHQDTRPSIASDRRASAPPPTAPGETAPALPVTPPVAGPAPAPGPSSAREGLEQRRPDQDKELFEKRRAESAVAPDTGERARLAGRAQDGKQASDDQRAARDLATPRENKTAMKDAVAQPPTAAEPSAPADRLESGPPRPEGATEQSRAKSPAAPAPSSPPPQRAPASSPAGAPSAEPASVDVIGRLTVTDRSGAETALTDLVTRLGGAALARRSDADATVIEARVPRPAYAELIEGLARIGRFTPEQERAELPDPVRLRLRLGP